METTIGAELKRLRTLKGDSQRQVEESTKISNAYLSQIESGKAEQPSPRILHALANYYGANYTELMQLAGHLSSPTSEISEKRGLLNHPLLGELTQDETAFLEEVLQSYRKRKPPEE